jgi:hypothetical protein
VNEKLCHIYVQLDTFLNGVCMLNSFDISTQWESDYIRGPGTFTVIILGLSWLNRHLVVSPGSVDVSHTFVVNMYFD